MKKMNKLIEFRQRKNKKKNGKKKKNKTKKLDVKDKQNKINNAKILSLIKFSTVIII